MDSLTARSLGSSDNDYGYGIALDSIGLSYVTWEMFNSSGDELAGPSTRHICETSRPRVNLT